MLVFFVFKYKLFKINYSQHNFIVARVVVRICILTFHIYPPFSPLSICCIFVFVAFIFLDLFYFCSFLFLLFLTSSNSLFFTSSSHSQHQCEHNPKSNNSKIKKKKKINYYKNRENNIFIVLILCEITLNKCVYNK